MAGYTATQVASHAASTRKVYVRLAPYFEAYHGGMPMGYMAAYADGESGGRMGTATEVNGELVSSGGDTKIAEFGIFQLELAQEKRFGLPHNYRTSIAGNFFLACLEENTNAAIAAKDYGVPVGSKDAWLLSHSCFALGCPGTRQVVASANKAGYLNGGEIYPGLIRWALDTGAYALGRVTAAKVAHRILVVSQRWDIGVQSGVSMTYGAPCIPRPPSNTSYSLPSNAAGLLGECQASSGAALVGLAALALAAKAWLFS